MHMNKIERRNKLLKLAELEGFDSVDGLIEATAHGSVSPGICTAGECNYTTEVEPDQDKGWCELCGKGTVQSALILAGLIDGGGDEQDHGTQ